MNYEQLIREYKDLQTKTREIANFLLINDCFSYWVDEITFPDTREQPVSVKYRMGLGTYTLDIPTEIVGTKNWKPLARKYKEKLLIEKYNKKVKNTEH